MAGAGYKSTSLFRMWHNVVKKIAKKKKLYVGIDTELKLKFSELKWNYFLKHSKGKFCSAIIVTTTSGSIDVGISLSRTALDVTLGASAHVGDSVRALGGGDNKISNT